MANFFSRLGAAFSLNAPHQIGIDLGAKAVKIVALRNNNSANPKLVGLAMEETPMGVIMDGKLNDSRSLADLVKRTLDRAGIPYKGIHASVGLRGINVIYKRLLLPFQAPEEMGQQILLEAQQHVLSDLADWIIDFQILTTPDNQGQVSVMLVAAKREVVQEYAALLQMIGVSSSIYDCDVFAIENALEHSLGSTQETVLCLDIGCDSTKMNLMQDGIPIVVRSFSPGGFHLTETIARSLGVDFDEAEALKIEASTKKELTQPEILEAITHHTGELCEEIKRTLEFFANSTTESSIESIDRVVLSGGGASTLGLDEGIKKFLNAEVVFSNPFARIQTSSNLKDYLEIPQHSFSVATGLALRFFGDKPT
jgi:type IV pilus assembly protein PilM